MKKKMLISALVTLSAFSFFSCGGGGGSSSSNSSSSNNSNIAQEEPNNNPAPSSASVGGKVSDQNASSQGVLSAQVTNNQQKARVKLILDTDGNGLFEESKDKVYQAVVDNKGAFSFPKVEFSGNEVKAKIIIEKDGRLPFTKVITIKKDENKLLNAKLTPVKAEVKTKDTISKNTSDPSSQSIRKGDIEIGADVDKIKDADKIDKVKILIKDINLQTEGKYLPQEFEAVDIDGNTTSFNVKKIFFLSVTTLDGKSLEPINDNDKVFFITVYNIDVDDGEYKVYGFGEEHETWEEIGTVTVQNKTATIELNRFDYNWFAIGQEVAQTQELTLNIEAKDNNGNPISNIYVYGFNTQNGDFIEGFTDENGALTLNLKSSSCDNNGYLLYYYNNFTGTEVPITNITDGNSENTCNTTIEVNNPYDANVTVKVGESNKFTCVEGITDEGFIDCGLTDEEGKINFKLISDKDYKAFSVSIGSRKFTAKDGSLIDLTKNSNQQPVNNLPTVYIDYYPYTVKTGQSVQIFAYAEDIDFDKLTIGNPSCGENGVNPNIVEQYNEEDGFAYITFECNYSSEGQKTPSVKFSDGKDEKTAQATIKVESASANTPPQIYGYTIYYSNYIPLNPESIPTGEEITIELYTFDADGDNLSITVNDNNNCKVEGNKIKCTFNETGDKSISITVKDGNGETATTNISLKVVSQTEAKLTIYDKFYSLTSEKIKFTVYGSYEDDTNNISITNPETNQPVNCETYKWCAIGYAMGSPVGEGETGCSQYYTDFECSVEVSLDKIKDNNNYNLTLNVGDYSKSIEFTDISKVLNRVNRGESIDFKEAINFFQNTKCIQPTDDLNTICKWEYVNENALHKVKEKCIYNGYSDNEIYTFTISQNNNKVVLTNNEGYTAIVDYIDTQNGEICAYDETEGFYGCVKKLPEIACSAISFEKDENNYENKGDNGYSNSSNHTISRQDLYNFFSNTSKIWGMDKILFECDVTTNGYEVSLSCKNADTGEHSNDVTLDFSQNLDDSIYGLIGNGFICFEDIRGSVEESRCIFNSNEILLNPLYKKGKDEILNQIAGKIFEFDNGSCVEFNNDGTGIFYDRYSINQGDENFTYELRCENNECYIYIPMENEEDDYLYPLYFDGQYLIFNSIYYTDNNPQNGKKANNNIVKVVDQCRPAKTLYEIIQDYSYIINGTISGNISQYTKIRIVPDVNQQEGNYDGIVCDIDETTGNFGNKCVAWVDENEINNLFNDNHSCQLIVFEDTNESWRFDREEQGLYGTTINCGELTNLNIDVNSYNYGNNNGNSEETGNNSNNSNSNEYVPTNLNVEPMQVSLQNVQSIMDSFSSQGYFYLIDSNGYEGKVNITKNPNGTYTITNQEGETFNVSVVEDSNGVYFEVGTRDKIFLASEGDGYSKVICAKNNDNSGNIDCLSSYPIFFDTSSDRAINTLIGLGTTKMLKYDSNKWVESSYKLIFNSNQVTYSDGTNSATASMTQDKNGIVKITSDVDTQEWYVLTMGYNNSGYDWAIVYMIWYDKNGNFDDADVRILKRIQ